MHTSSVIVQDYKKFKKVKTNFYSMLLPLARFYLITKMYHILLPHPKKTHLAGCSVVDGKANCLGSGRYLLLAIAFGALIAPVPRRVRDSHS